MKPSIFFGGADFAAQIFQHFAVMFFAVCFFSY